MIVEQFPYMSPEAWELRRRDGIPPWSLHPCEVDSILDVPPASLFAAEVAKARAIRDALESA